MSSHINQPQVMEPQSHSINFDILTPHVLTESHFINQKQKNHIHLPRIFTKTTTQLQLLMINHEVYRIGEENEAYKCRFNTFLIPYALVIVQLLKIQQPKNKRTSQEDLYIECVLKAVLKQIWKVHKQFYEINAEVKIQEKENKVKVKQSDQDQEVLGYLLFLMKHEEKTEEEINKMLKKFLSVYGSLMETVMPIYKMYFDEVANKQDLLREANISEPDLDHLIEGRLNKIVKIGDQMHKKSLEKQNI